MYSGTILYKKEYYFICRKCNVEGLVLITKMKETSGSSIQGVAEGHCYACGEDLKASDIDEDRFQYKIREWVCESFSYSGLGPKKLKLAKDWFSGFKDNPFDDDCREKIKSRYWQSKDQIEIEV